MAWLSDVSFKVAWPVSGPPKATIAYTIGSSDFERREFVLDWSEHIVLLVRVGQDKKPDLPVSPRPSDADRLLDGPPEPIGWVRIDSASPPSIARTHGYSFSAHDQATIGSSNWDRLYAVVHLLPEAGIGDEAFVDAQLDWARARLPGPAAYVAAYSPTPTPPDPEPMLAAALDRQTAVLQSLLRGSDTPSTRDMPSTEEHLTAALERYTEAVNRVLTLKLSSEPHLTQTQQLPDTNRLIAALEEQTTALMRLAAKDDE
jgi:hypothetical protein